MIPEISIMPDLKQKINIHNMYQWQFKKKIFINFVI